MGGDGGLLGHPVHQQALTLAPGQRADVLLDLTGLAAGTEVHFEHEDMGMMRNFRVTSPTDGPDRGSFRCHLSPTSWN